MREKIETKGEGASSERVECEKSPEEQAARSARTRSSRVDICLYFGAWCSKPRPNICAGSDGGRHRE
jgi:hypothetical protein